MKRNGMVRFAAAENSLKQSCVVPVSCRVTRPREVKTPWQQKGVRPFA